MRKDHWKAYQPKKGTWQLFDISKDIEEKNDLAASEPVILDTLIVLAKSSHQPIKPGKIYDRKLMAKDHRQAPHHRKPKKK